MGSTGGPGIVPLLDLYERASEPVWIVGHANGKELVGKGFCCIDGLWEEWIERGEFCCGWAKF